MVEYRESSVFPAPLDRLWRLLRAHLEDGTIHSIHKLVRSQETVSHEGAETVVDRTIDVRGTLLKSRWKLTYRPPEYARWEILESPGPWSPGSYVESTYTSDPGGTLIESRGDLRIKVLPFFLPQKRFIRNVLSTIEEEDIAFVRA